MRQDSAVRVQSSRSAGFTLVELLVTIGIIAILAAILLPAIRGAFMKAEKSTAQTEIRSIENAVKAFYNEYSKYPTDAAGTMVEHYGKLGGKQNSDLMNILRAVDATPNTAHVCNPRKIVFLDINVNTNSALAPVGCALDPWDNQYEITVDIDFDNICKSKSSDGDVVSKGVVVWSYGPDGKEKTSDDLCSWKN